MEVSGSCDYCGEKQAVSTCEVCGAKICGDHKREFGCEVCRGGEQKF